MRQDRLLEIVGRIVQRPETWDQFNFMPNTNEDPVCVLCHGARDSGVDVTSPTAEVFRAGKAYLGLRGDDAHWLFAPLRTLPELIQFATTGKRP